MTAKLRARLGSNYIVTLWYLKTIETKKIIGEIKYSEQRFTQQVSVKISRRFLTQAVALTGTDDILNLKLVKQLYSMNKIRKM